MCVCVCACACVRVRVRASFEREKAKHVEEIACQDFNIVKISLFEINLT